MPISPPPVLTLLNVYDRIVEDATDFVGAARDIAPAAVRDFVCTLGKVNSLIGGPLGRVTSPGGLARTLTDLGGILQAACPVPPPLPPGIGPPFTGGQCPFLYTLTYTYEEWQPFSQPAPAQGSPFVRPVLGPFSGLQAVSPKTINGIPGFGQIQVRQANGTFTIHQASGNTAFRNPRIISLVPQNGGPDECGDPPTPPRPPRPPIDQPPRSPRIPYVRPDGQPGPDIFIDTRIGPIFVDVDATLKVPVVVSFTGGDIINNVTIPVSVSLPDFNVEITYGGSGGNPGKPGDPQEPTPPVGICCDPPLPRVEDGKDEDPDEPPAEDPPPAGKILGVIVNSIQINSTSNASTVFTASPPLLVPRIATVQFGLQAGEEQSISADTQVKQRTQFVPAPQGMDVIRAFIRWEPGWDGEFKYVIGPANRNL